jgi:pilus assembly protein TadC
MSMIDSAYFSDLNELSKEKEDDGEACIANISLLERQKRLRFGIRQFIFSLVILGILIVLHLNPLWRLLLLFMFWASAVGYFQARDKT